MRGFTTTRSLLVLLFVLALLVACAGSPPGQDPQDPPDSGPEPAPPNEDTSFSLCGAPLAIFLLLGLAMIVLARPVQV